MAFLRHRDVRVDNINWDAPPPWAAEWDRNDFVFGTAAAAGEIVQRQDKPKRSLTELASKLG